jgi:hypothetical protein
LAVALAIAAAILAVKVGSLVLYKVVYQILQPWACFLARKLGRYQGVNRFDRNLRRQLEHTRLLSAGRQAKARKQASPVWRQQGGRAGRADRRGAVGSGIGYCKRAPISPLYIQNTRRTLISIYIYSRPRFWNSITLRE